MLLNKIAHSYISNEEDIDNFGFLDYIEHSTFIYIINFRETKE